MSPLIFGALIVVVIYVFWVIAARRANPLWLAIGEDGRLSTSKFQFLLWTIAALYTYASLAAAWHGHAPQPSQLPVYVLIAMGISLSTAVGAKAIAVSYGANPNTGNPVGAKVVYSLDLRYLVCGNSNAPDLVKCQMLAWTAVALASYLLDFSSHFGSFSNCTAVINGSTTCFPDIDPTLMILMGLGHGAYIGNKLVPLLPPSLTRATAQRTGTPPNTSVTIQLFGTGLETADVTAENLPVSPQWLGGVGTFPLPASLAVSGTQVTVNASLDGTSCTTSVTIP